ncbi:MAG: HD-GYP domain-containing protein [Candidatus Omnitrophica bacterium]|nr:HD-GYP domain-containing protein [Candidatus Omnitrophota bacterium]
MFDEANTIVGFICLSSDITRLRQAEEELKKNKEKLEVQTWGLEKTKSGFKLLYNGLENKKAELQQSIDRLKRILLESVDALASAAEKRDPYTAGHQQRVAALACEIAKELGFSEEQIEGIKIAGVLHDIGKIYVPDALLTKISKLTDAEFSEIKNHAKFGYDILKKIEFSWPVAQIVFQHHERLNGSGYPQKLSGEEIILEARIVGVADVVEAMAAPRPYRAALGIDTALNEIMRHKGTLYDPEVVDICCRLFREKGYRLTGGENN